MDSRVLTMTLSWISSFMASMDGAIISAPVYLPRMSLPSCSSVRLALRGSACWVEITTVWISKGSTEPSAFWLYLMVTWFLPSERRLRGDLTENHHHVVLGGRLAGNLRVRVGSQACVKDGIRDLVSNLVGVALVDRLRGEHEDALLGGHF